MFAEQCWASFKRRLVKRLVELPPEQVRTVNFLDQVQEVLRAFSGDPMVDGRVFVDSVKHAIVRVLDGELV